MYNTRYHAPYCAKCILYFIQGVRILMGWVSPHKKLKFLVWRTRRIPATQIKGKWISPVFVWKISEREKSSIFFPYECFMQKLLIGWNTSGSLSMCYWKQCMFGIVYCSHNLYSATVYCYRTHNLKVCRPNFRPLDLWSPLKWYLSRLCSLRLYGRLCRLLRADLMSWGTHIILRCLF